jgi:hypothetical protein
MVIGGPLTSGTSTDELAETAPGDVAARTSNARLMDLYMVRSSPVVFVEWPANNSALCVVVTARDPGRSRISTNIGFR